MKGIECRLCGHVEAIDLAQVPLADALADVLLAGPERPPSTAFSRAETAMVEHVAARHASDPLLGDGQVVALVDTQAGGSDRG